MCKADQVKSKFYRFRAVVESVTYPRVCTKSHFTSSIFDAAVQSNVAQQLGVLGGLCLQLEMWGCSPKLICCVPSHIWFALKTRCLRILKAQLNASTCRKLIGDAWGFLEGWRVIDWPFIKSWNNLKYRTSQNHKLWFRPTWLFWIITSTAHWVSQELVFSSVLCKHKMFLWAKYY